MTDVFHSSTTKLTLDRCKSAEYERQKEEIQTLKLEVALLKRRASMANSVQDTNHHTSPEKASEQSGNTNESQ
jgi:cell shape-determining protein MreC